MSSIITLKRGATFRETLGFTNADGSAYALTGVTLTAMLCDAEENPVATLTPTPTGVAGQAMIYVQDTSAWPEGLLRMDVWVQLANGDRAISQTFGIEVAHAITQTLPAAAPFDPVAGVAADPASFDGEDDE